MASASFSSPVSACLVRATLPARDVSADGMPAPPPELSWCCAPCACKRQSDTPARDRRNSSASVLHNYLIVVGTLLRVYLVLPAGKRAVPLRSLAGKALPRGLAPPRGMTLGVIWIPS